MTNREYIIAALTNKFDDMETHNGIRKSEMMDVIRFMWNLIFDCASGPGVEE